MNPSAVQRRIDDAVVTALSDGTVEASLRIFGNQAEEARQILATRGLSPALHISVNAFVVQLAGRTTLVDTGSGGKMGPTLGRLAASLIDAGINAASVDTILLTHMHPDHSNGLTDALGAAVFPNAELVLHEEERAHWLDDARMAQASPRQKRDDFEAARRELTPYRNRTRLFRGGEVVPGIRALPLPGHTPGHCGYLIGSGGETLLIWGDTVHLADVQIARPDISVVLDTDRDAAVATRRRILDMAATERFLVGGMHLHFPGFVRVTRDGHLFRLEPA